MNRPNPDPWKLAWRGMGRWRWLWLILLLLWLGLIPLEVMRGVCRCDIAGANAFLQLSLAPTSA